MPVPAHGPLDPRARHLQDIAIAQGAPTIRIEPLLEGSADPTAIVDRDVPWRTVNADLDERSVRCTADAQVGQVEPQRVQPGSEGLDKTLSEHEKKARAELRPHHVGNVAGVPSMSTERPAQVRHHATVPSARAPMGEEAVASLGAAPGRDRDLVDAEVPGLPRQDFAQVELDCAG